MLSFVKHMLGICFVYRQNHQMHGLG